MAGWTPSLPADVEVVTDYETALETWCKKDLKVRFIVVNTLSNSLLMHLVNTNSLHEYFTTLSTLFEHCLLVASTELQHQLMKLRLKKGRDIHMHI
ncbi:hypothetical protein L210DRAFT_848529 [Boletus edulis BED1]|uniref:Uncharacterized protein n=1 Tax=Boletus edulis BED1 TaxID=1328754 RepID=A0AAD4BZL6_BOLED|nr:hypothetical protein L210DRAFT_848529 [Boletus edulis BED1]